MIRSTKFLSLLLVLAVVFLASCSEDSQMISKDEYIEFYDQTAGQLGFESQAELIEEDDTFAFLAFDGIFTVGFTVDKSGFITFLSISTSSELGKALKTEEQLHEVLLWASYLALPFYKTAPIEYTETDNATVAGMLLASFEEEVLFDCMICTSSKNENGITISFIPT